MLPGNEEASTKAIYPSASTTSLLTTSVLTTSTDKSDKNNNNDNDNDNEHNDGFIMVTDPGLIKNGSPKSNVKRRLDSYYHY